MIGLLACTGAPDSADASGEADDAGVTEPGPTIEILSPDEATEAWESVHVDLVARVADPDYVPKKLSVDWTSDLDGAVGTAEPERSGEATTYGYLTKGAHVLTATVTSPGGRVNSVTVALEVGPSLHADLRLYSPAEGEVHASDATIAVRGGVNSQAMEASEYDLSVILDDREVLWTGHCDSVGSFGVDVGPFSVGAYQLTVEAQDPADRVGTSITVGFAVE